MGLAQLTLQGATNAEGDSESVAGILVLRNGNVLEGKIQLLAVISPVRVSRST